MIGAIRPIEAFAVYMDKGSMKVRMDNPTYKYIWYTWTPAGFEVIDKALTETLEAEFQLKRPLPVEVVRGEEYAKGLQQGLTISRRCPAPVPPVPLGKKD